MQECLFCEETKTLFDVDICLDCAMQEDDADAYLRDLHRQLSEAKAEERK